MKMHNDSSFFCLVSPGINFSVEPPVMEAPSWPYFDPDYETTCSRFTPPRYGAVKFFTPNLFLLLGSSFCFTDVIFRNLIWPAWVGCVARSGLWLRTTHTRTLQFLRWVILLSVVYFSFLLEHHVQNRCNLLWRLLLWCGGFLRNLVLFFCTKWILAVLTCRGMMFAGP